MKIDTSKIEGYDSMSAEEKLAALEGFEIEQDYSGYIKKDVFDKTAHELAEKKRELASKLTEDEAKKAKEAEERADLEEKYNKLLHETMVSKNKAKLLSLGYEDKLADETAEAMANGDLEKVFISQKKHLENFEKKIRADALKDTPRPKGDGDGVGMTLEKLKSLSPSERYEFSQKNPDEYKALYTGGN